MKTHHHSMNATVNKHKHPDGRAHEANASPHTQHRSGMMVGLQSRAPLALGDNDECVHDLVEFAKVKEPAPEREALIPQSSNVRRVRVSVRQVNHHVLRLPDIDSRVVGYSIPQSPRAVDFTECVCVLCHAIVRVPVRNDARYASSHCHEGREAVHCQRDIVQDHKGFPWLLSSDPPRSVVPASVPGVEQED